MTLEVFDHPVLESNPVDKIVLDARQAYESSPNNLRLFDRYMQLLIKYEHLTTAQSLIYESKLLHQHSAETALVKAHLTYKMKCYDEADVLFKQAILDFPEDTKLPLLFAQTLRKRKKVIQAFRVIQDINTQDLDKKQIVVYEDIIQLYQLIEKSEGRPLELHEDFSILAMKQAILEFQSTQELHLSDRPLGKVSLITGSLGPGGAERQLCMTAIHINKYAGTQSTASGIRIDSEVDVVINAFDTEDEKSFFLPLLKENQVRLFQIKSMPVTELDDLSISSARLLQLLKETPSPIRYGLNRLVQYFKDSATQVAFIWQDSAILFSALAALVAEVPRIVLNFRGYPPSLRPHLFKPEYYELYKSLAQVARVSFVTNTQATAKAYAQWLDIPLSRFTIIYNGISISHHNLTASPEALLWENFVQKTAGATETIGGVFRFETDKRPILFIRFIKRYLQKTPSARFILVGEGRLRSQCMSLAQELHIEHRILFVGLSKAVSFWMPKMDALVLLSLYEGLPNVLIEAQYLGLPVVATPAGGAEECFVEGKTGHILSSAENPDLYEACSKVSSLINAFKQDNRLKDEAKAFAKATFSIDGMVKNTINLLATKPIES